MARPVIALLTDFGTRDHYAGTMKGVVLGICPEATLVDISHEIDAHDVLGGALELAAAYRYFPSGTVFLVVIDPGVGSARRGIAAEIGGCLFVAPDKRTGDVWIATMGGLSRYSAGRFDNFTQLNSGLPNDVVYGVAVEGESVWVATAAGGGRMNPRTGEWSYFNERTTPM